MLGRTTGDTYHGNPGEHRKLPAGLVVNLEPADNLPADSPIKYWAFPYVEAWPMETADWADSVGCGLHADDVEIVTG